MTGQTAKIPTDRGGNGRNARPDLKSRGFGSMIVGGLANNASRCFYERLGGEHIPTREITVKGKRFQEYGYGWKNLGSLANTD